MWDLTTRLESAQAAAARHKAGKREAQAQAAQLEEENEQLVQRVRHLEDELAAEMQQRDDALVGAGPGRCWLPAVGWRLMPRGCLPLANLLLKADAAK